VANETLETLDLPTGDGIPGDLDVTLPDSSRDEVVSVGARIGRYVVLSTLGTGAMGLVLAAFDPELDRKVALKLLKTPGQAQSRARTRLQREAQALAKLDHRNVVAVYDVGVHEQQLFVGMEFVAGQTLGAWMASSKQPWPWQEVLRVFMEAGCGLAAAHDAALVHRDFKPDNVMLGNDGRVRVMDFGLARASGDAEEDEPTEADDSRIERIAKHLLVERMTQTGAMLGTPAYMSFEQFEGKPADARSDQFAYCVALYEALYGERPFAGAGLAELIASLEAERVRPAAKGTTVPVWLRKVVIRGLSKAPEQRWPSMHELLAALADDPSVRRRKWWMAAAAVMLSIAGGTALWFVMRADARACTGFEQRLEGVWDESRRDRVQAAILATQLSYAPDTWMRVQQRLDDYTEQWVAARESACEATRQGEQSGELLDLRMACLDERLQHVDAVVQILAEADETVVKKAVEAVIGLPTLERCADLDALTADIPPPEDPDAAARLAELEGWLVKAEGLHRAGKYAESLALADKVEAAAAQLAYEPLQARAWLRQGSSRFEVADHTGAEAALERAYEAAVALRMPVEAASASVRLMQVEIRLARLDDGRRWAKHAKPLARAVGTDEAYAMYLNTLGTLAYTQGEFAEARDLHQRALAIRERALGTDHLDVAVSLHNLGLTLWSERDYERARSYHERALAIRENILGPGHPVVASSLNSLGMVAWTQVELDDAIAYFERALAIQESALGSNHPDLAISLNNLGAVAEKAGELERAHGYFTRAIDIWEQTLGLDHPNLAYGLTGLGELLLNQGKPAEALPYLERAVSIRAAQPGDPTALALTRFALARALWDVPVDAGRDRARASTLAELARVVYVEAGEGLAKDMQRVEAWQRTRPSP
jgi:tetratricopeptide (TPR) repeat protein